MQNNNADVQTAQLSFAGKSLAVRVAVGQNYYNGDVALNSLFHWMAGRDCVCCDRQPGR